MQSKTLLVLAMYLLASGPASAQEDLDLRDRLRALAFSILSTQEIQEGQAAVESELSATDLIYVNASVGLYESISRHTSETLVMNRLCDAMQCEADKETVCAQLDKSAIDLASALEATVSSINYSLNCLETAQAMRFMLFVRSRTQELLAATNLAFRLNSE